MAGYAPLTSPHGVLPGVSGLPPVNVKPSWIKRRLPVLAWLPKYDIKEDLLSDVIGGVTIGMVCFAQTLAHAAIATTKPVQGPYCAYMPALAYAFLGTSPHASLSSGAIAAIIIADQLKPWQDEDDRTELASFLAFVSGVMLVLFGVLKLSSAVRFLSEPTLSGFVTGGSILIVSQQLKNLFGFYSESECKTMGNPDCVAFPHTDHFVKLCSALLEFLPFTDPLSLMSGLSLMLFLKSMNDLKAFAKKASETSPRAKWPAWAKRLSEMKEILVVLLASTVCYLAAVDGKPVLATIGHIPAGLPPYRNPLEFEGVKGLLRNQVPAGKAGESEWIDSPGILLNFIGGGALVAFTTFLTTFSTTKKMSIKNQYVLDPTQEMLALGGAGIAGGFFGAFPPSGSLSRTGLADECGVKTQLGGVFCAGIVGLGLVFLTPVLQFLPKCTLAAIIITSTKNLIDFSTPKALLKFWRPPEEGGLKRDFLVWCLAFFFTVFQGVLEGIAMAVFVSVVRIVMDAAAPPAVALGRVEDAGGRRWRNLANWPDAKRFPGVLVFEFRGPLSFASAEWFSDSVEEHRRQEEADLGVKVKFIICSFASVHQLDYTAMQVLKEMLKTWKKQGVGCFIVGVKHTAQVLIEESLDPTGELVDRDMLCSTIEDAVNVARKKTKPGAVAYRAPLPPQA